MVTYTWIGNQGTSDPNDAGQAVNWSPSGVPGNSDTIILGTGATLDAGAVGTNSTSTGLVIQATGADTLNLINQNFVQASFTLGGGTTLNLTGTGPTSAGFDIGGSGNSSAIHQSGSGASLTINAVGTVNSNALIYLDSANGSLTLNVTQNGTARGDYYSQGAIFNLGGTLTINSDNSVATGNNGNRFSNASYMMIASQNGSAVTKLNARMDGTDGVISLAQAVTAALLEINTNLTGAQIVEFGASNNGTVRIDATNVLPAYANVGAVTTTVLQNTLARFGEFGPGDTIDLAGISAAGLTYSFGNDPTWGNNVLTLIRNGSTVVARLRFTGSSAFADGTASNFVLAADSAGTGTAITVSATPVSVVNAGTTYQVGGASAVFNGPTNSATLNWGSAANWAGGSAAGLPGQYQAVIITNSVAQLAGFVQYELDVSAAQTAGGLALDDHFVKLKISAALTLAATPGQSSGGGLTQTAGLIDIVSGGVVTTTNIFSLGTISIEAGGSLAIAGAAPFALGAGLQGLAAEGSVSVAGATITSGGAIIIGNNASASFSAITSSGTASSVTASFTNVGAGTATDPNQFGGSTASSLTISGAGTVWRDVGGDASSGYSGAMLVGGGSTSVNALGTVSVGTGGSGFLTVDQGATLIDSAYASLGVRAGSVGNATLQNGAQWKIGNGATPLPSGVTIGSSTVFGATPPLLSVGLLGSGSLDVSSGATLTFNSSPSVSTQFNLVVAHGASTLTSSVTGTVTVNGGVIDSSLGAVGIGQRGDGVMRITNGGTVIGGPGTAAAAGAALGTRNYVLNGTTTAGTGTLTIGGGTGTSLLRSTSGFVNGLDGIGNVTVSTGGSLQVSGIFWEGGFNGSGLATDTGSNILVQGGTVSVGNGATLYTGSNLDLESGALEIGSIGSGSTGNLTIAAGTTVTVLRSLSANALSKITDNAAGGTLVNAGTVNVASAGASLEIAANVGGAGVFQATNAASLKFDRLVGNGATVALGGTASTGTLELLSPIAFNGTIDNFWGTTSGPQNHILLDNIGTIAPGLNWNQIDATHGTLAVTINGSIAANLTIAGFHPGGFTQSAITGGLSLAAVDTAPCFAAGTKITTARGDIAVEALHIGDQVTTLSGRRPITWIGHRRVACAGHPRPWDVNPVHIQPHAFAPSQPTRDLWLSPDHAVFHAGMLIPIRYLINGATITQETRDAVTYFHVELDTHDVLLAENLPAESFLDTGNRGAFANGGGAVMMHPDFALKTWAASACAPLAVDGDVVHAARAHLLDRAIALGHATTDDPGVHLLADGAAIQPDWIGDEIGFVLPEHFSELRLVSRDFVPAEHWLASNDRRRLGVAVHSLVVDGEPVAPVGDGWYPPADGLHWTDGSARIPVRTGAVLELRMAPIGRYWRGEKVTPRAVA